MSEPNEAIDSPHCAHCLLLKPSECTPGKFLCLMMDDSIDFQEALQRDVCDCFELRDPRRSSGIYD